jgi:hypothetical protein
MNRHCRYHNVHCLGVFLSFFLAKESDDSDAGIFVFWSSKSKMADARNFSAPLAHAIFRARQCGRLLLATWCEAAVHFVRGRRPSDNRQLAETTEALRTDLRDRQVAEKPNKGHASPFEWEKFVCTVSS